MRSKKEGAASQRVALLANCDARGGRALSCGGGEGGNFWHEAQVEAAAAAGWGGTGEGQGPPGGVERAWRGAEASVFGA